MTILRIMIGPASAIVLYLAAVAGFVYLPSGGEPAAVAAMLVIAVAAGFNEKWVVQVLARVTKDPAATSAGNVSEE